MPIYSLKGMIMDVASSKSEAIAVWICSGFNTRNAIWRFEITRREINLELVYPIDGNFFLNYLNAANEPWRLDYETLWQITNKPDQKLKYIYVFPNPSDKQRLDNLEDIDGLINNCLDILKGKKINSVSFILIPALPGGDHNTEIEDIASAKRMIACIQNWLKENKSSIDVYLVDRLDSFSPILEEQNH